MWPYWVMFLLPAAAAVVGGRGVVAGRADGRRLRLGARWWAVVAGLTLLIGLRVEVGGDWFNYFRYLEDVRGLSVTDVLLRGDPGFQILNWVSEGQGWDIYGTNLLGGAIFAFGLAVFCRSLPRPWLALAAAVPYLVIVVAMGYSRQGIALGLAMLGLVALGRQSVRAFVFWVLLAATFHKTAVLLLPVAALAAARNRHWTALWVLVASVAGYFLLLEDSVDALYQNYVEAQYQSEGAFIRLAMNALPAGILLLWRRRFDFGVADRKLWTWFAVISIGLFLLYWATSATTALDRVGLYMLPLQLVVFSHLPDVSRIGRSRELKFAVLLYYGAVQFVWLNFASHAEYWLPYRFYPLEVWF